MGPFELLYDGRGGLPAIAYTLTDPAGPASRSTISSDRVRMRGWQIASYPLPAEPPETVVQRILVRHGVSRDMAALLAADLRRAIEYFARRIRFRAPASTASGITTETRCTASLLRCSCWRRSPS